MDLCGYLLLSLKFLDTRCQILLLQCTKFDFRLELHPKAPPGELAVLLQYRQLDFRKRERDESKGREGENGKWGDRDRKG